VDAEFAKVLRSLAGSPEAEIRQAIEEYLQDPASFDQVAGRWLESAVDDDLLAALADPEKVGAAGKAAASTLSILDGGVLEELVCYVNRNLHLDRLRDVVDRASLDALDPWLKEALSRFLGEEMSLDGLEPIRKTLAFLDREAQSVFDSTLSALNQTYSAAFSAAYSRTGTNAALLDVCFDFSRDPGLSGLLACVIDGDWRTVLLESRAGVTLRKAVLSHGIRRQSHVEFNLPYLSGGIARIADSLSSMTVVEDGERVFVYEFRARDEIRARHKWRSIVSISGKLHAQAGDAVRVFASQ
jgi:hypothetical protein